MKHVEPATEKRALIVRLHKIRGQVEAIERLMRNNAECTEVLNQIISARNGLKSLGGRLIQSHVHQCIENAPNITQGRRALRSLITVLDRYVV